MTAELDYDVVGPLVEPEGARFDYLRLPLLFGKSQLAVDFVEELSKIHEKNLDNKKPVSMIALRGVFKAILSERQRRVDPLEVKPSVCDWDDVRFVKAFVRSVWAAKGDLNLHRPPPRFQHSWFTSAGHHLLVELIDERLSADERDLLIWAYTARGNQQVTQMALFIDEVWARWNAPFLAKHDAKRRQRGAVA